MSYRTHQIRWCFKYFWVSLVAQTVKNLPTMKETCVQSLGREDPLDKGMTTHSSTTHLSILAWRIPWREEPGGLQSMGSQRVRHDWATNTQVLLADKDVIWSLWQTLRSKQREPQRLKQSQTIFFLFAYTILFLRDKFGALTGALIETDHMTMGHKLTMWSELPIMNWVLSDPAVPNLLGTKDQFHARKFCHRWDHGGGMVSGWFKHISIVHFISIIITPALPQIISH